MQFLVRRGPGTGTGGAGASPGPDMHTVASSWVFRPSAPLVGLKAPPEAKKKAPLLQNETTNGPAAKEARPSAEGSSSEESSSDGKEEVKRAP